MEYDGLKQNEIPAAVNEWLDVTYTAKKYLADESSELAASNVPVKRKLGSFFAKKQAETSVEVYEQASSGSEGVAVTKKRPSKVFLRLSIVALVLALLVGAFFLADSFMDGQLRLLAKETFIVPVFGGSVDKNYEMSVPCNINVDDVNNGVITFSGGSVILSFTDGTVSKVSDDSITVAINDTTSITYQGATHSYVAVGDKVAVNQLLAKFVDTASASIYHNGELVQSVIGSETSIKWSV